MKKTIFRSIWSMIISHFISYIMDVWRLCYVITRLSPYVFYTIKCRLSTCFRANVQHYVLSIVCILNFKNSIVRCIKRSGLAESTQFVQMMHLSSPLQEYNYINCRMDPKCRPRPFASDQSIMFLTSLPPLSYSYLWLFFFFFQNSKQRALSRVYIPMENFENSKLFPGARIKYENNMGNNNRLRLKNTESSVFRYVYRDINIL